MLQVPAGTEEPRGLRQELIPIGPRLTAALLFGGAGLMSALVAWTILDSDTHPIVVTAIAATTVAGALLGAAVARWARTPHPIGQGRRTALVGVLTGVAIHPTAWLTFVLFAWCSAWLSGRAPKGHLIEGLGNALVWAVASLTYGFLLTVPAFGLAAWVYIRVVGPANPPPTTSP